MVRSGDRFDTLEVFEFMTAHREAHAIATLCRVLAVSPSGYYAWRHRARSLRVGADAALIDEIRAIHRHSRGTYGAPRIQAELVARGRRVSRKRVAHLMRRAGLRGVSRRKWVTTTVRDRAHRPAPDLVQRAFTASGPNRLWVLDIERHEALFDRAVVKGHRPVSVAAGAAKLRAA